MCWRRTALRLPRQRRASEGAADPLSFSAGCTCVGTFAFGDRTIQARTLGSACLPERDGRVLRQYSAVVNGDGVVNIFKRRNVGFKEF
jgi:hypothetical protein